MERHDLTAADPQHASFEAVGLSFFVDTFEERVLRGEAYTPEDIHYPFTLTQNTISYVDTIPTYEYVVEFNNQKFRLGSKSRIFPSFRNHEAMRLQGVTQARPQKPRKPTKSPQPSANRTQPRPLAILAQPRPSAARAPIPKPTPSAKTTLAPSANPPAHPRPKPLNVSHSAPVVWRAKPEIPEEDMVKAHSAQIETILARQTKMEEKMGSPNQEILARLTALEEKADTQSRLEEQLASLTQTVNKMMEMMQFNASRAEGDSLGAARGL